MKEKGFFYLKITTGMLFSFYISLLLVQHVFSDFRPEVRQDLPEYIALRLYDITEPVKQLLNGKNNERSEPTLSDLQKRAIQVAPGVKASESDSQLYNEIRSSRVETRIIEVQLSNGSKVKVEVQKDAETAPPIELIEAVEGL